MPAVLVVGLGGYALGSADDEGAKPAERDVTPKAGAQANAITLAQARVIPLGIPRSGVLSRFGPPKPAGSQGPDSTRPKGLQCVYYNFAGTPEGDFRLCFRGDRLATVTAIYP